MKKIRSGVKAVLKELKRCDDASDFAGFLHGIDAAIIAFIKMITFIFGLRLDEEDDGNESANKRRPGFYRQFTLKNVFSDGYAVTDSRYTLLHSEL